MDLKAIKSAILGIESACLRSPPPIIESMKTDDKNFVTVKMVAGGKIYSKRYSLAELAVLIAGEDDDTIHDTFSDDDLRRRYVEVMDVLITLSDEGSLSINDDLQVSQAIEKIRTAYGQFVKLDPRDNKAITAKGNVYHLLDQGMDLVKWLEAAYDYDDEHFDY